MSDGARQPLLRDDEVDEEDVEQARPLDRVSTAARASKWANVRARVNTLSAVKRPRGGVLPRVIGAEPSGPTRDALRNMAVNVPAVATIVEFGSSAFKESGNLSNAAFLAALEELGPLEAPFRARWINISGLSFDVLEALGEKYKLHPLALEDMAHVPQRTKVDYYQNFVYVSCSLILKESNSDVSRLQRAATALDSRARVGDANSTRAPLLKAGKQSGKMSWLSVENMLAAVDAIQCSLLLLKDGTVVSVFQRGGDGVREPVDEKLRTSGTMLRESEDPSFLLHALMDAIIDLASEVVEAYEEDVALSEAAVLRDPNVDSSAEVHLIQGELVALRRAIAPLRSVIASLKSNRTENRDWDPISDTTRVFLGDLHDHVSQAVDNLDSLERQAASLIEFIFNLMSIRTNESMRSLAVVSIVFLPVTFLASVYGTNFQDFPDIHERSIYYFWALCAVITAAVLILLRVTNFVTWPRNPFRRF
ncbi:hypothetical protein DFJ74DRAFT_666997 [Hyaloraphidium curvatum]|nr:hypothetical protein DFJ74DRAFT_666997 [Hyaloraphidium curvatum]